MKLSKALILKRIDQGVTLPVWEAAEEASLTSGHVRIRVLASPINPADINMLEGRYVIRPDCPFVPGNEGVGQVEACGEGVDSSWKGKRVIVPFQAANTWEGWWQETRVLPVNACIEVPEHVSNEQAAMFSINPLTAHELLRQFVALKPGDWIIQNAANSAVGRWVIYWAKQWGIQTVNMVRRPELAAELLALGATRVYVEEANSAASCAEKGRCRLALNGVGGESAAQLARCLADEGHLVTYGAMSKEPVVLNNALLIYKRIHAHGFNRTLWGYGVTYDEAKTLYQTLFMQLKKAPFSIPIHKTYPFSDYKHALKTAQQEGLNGKVLFSGK